MPPRRPKRQHPPMGEVPTVYFPDISFGNTLGRDRYSGGEQWGGWDTYNDLESMGAHEFTASRHYARQNQQFEGGSEDLSSGLETATEGRHKSRARKPKRARQGGTKVRDDGGKRDRVDDDRSHGGSRICVCLAWATLAACAVVPSSGTLGIFCV